MKKSRKSQNGCQYGCFKRAILAAFVFSFFTVFFTLNSTLNVDAKTYSAAVINHLKAGTDFLKTGNFEQSRSEFKAAIDIEPQCPEALNDIGVSYLRQNNRDAAADWFQKALDVDPLFPNSLNNLALIMYRKGDYASAIRCYRQALKLENKNDCELETNLANALRDKGNFKEAEEQYKQTIKTNADFAPAHNGISQLYYGENRYEEACREAEKAIKLKPDYAFAYYNLGLIQSALKNRSEALAAFQQSLKYEVNPNYAQETKRQIALLSQSNSSFAQSDEIDSGGIQKSEEYIRTQKWQLAERELKSLVDGPAASDPVVWNNYGLALSHVYGNRKNQKESYGHAAVAFRRAIALRPQGFPTAQYNLGQVLRLLGDDAGAEAAFRKAIADGAKTGNSYPLAENVLGVLLKQKGNYHGAADAYRKAISESADDLPIAHYNLAIVLEKMDKTREAVNEYKTYLRLAPNGLNVKLAKLRLKRLGIEV